MSDYNYAAMKEAFGEGANTGSSPLPTSPAARFSGEVSGILLSYQS